MARRARRVLALGALASLTALGCSSARMAGGASVIPGDEPDGARLGLWRTERCRDRHGAPALEPSAKIELIRTQDGRVVLVDTRLGYDTVVADNGAREGDEWVFDLALKRERGRPYLRQYRLPEAPGANGRYLLTADFQDWEAGDAFRARVSTTAVECTLSPSRS